MFILRSIFVGILAFLLIISFGLHTIEVKHSHPGINHGHTHDQGGKILNIDEYVHGIEKKFFIVILLSLLATSVFLFPTVWRVVNLIENYFKNFWNLLNVLTQRIFCFLILLYKTGVLNTKVH